MNQSDRGRVFLIAWREFTVNIKRRSFLFTAFGIPLLVIAIQVAMGYFVEQQGQTTGTLGLVGYVDLTPEQLLAGAEAKPAEFRAFASEQEARAALLDGQIGVYFVVPADYLSQGDVHAYSLRDVPRGIEDQMSEFIGSNLVANWPPDYAARLQDPLNLRIETIGEKNVMDEETVMGVILVPFIFALLFTMSILTTSGFLLQGVVEEKENRLVEILLTSASPMQILGGKILGLGALGLVQVIVWATAGALVLSQGSALWSGLDKIHIPTSMLTLGSLYLLLGYFLFGSLLAGIGAAVTSMQEGQQISSIISLIAVIPLILSITFISNPNGRWPVVMSLFPFTAPLGMILRLPLADVPSWQIGLSLSLLFLTTLAVVWVSAQVFRTGLLRYDRRLDLRSLWATLRRVGGGV